MELGFPEKRKKKDMEIGAKGELGDKGEQGSHTFLDK